MSYNQYNQQSNPYRQGPSAESGYGYNYGGQQEQHEMQPYGSQQYGGQQQQPAEYMPEQQQQQAAPSASSYAMSQRDFLGQVEFTRSEIRSLTTDVQSIATLHSRALTGDDSARQQLEVLVAEASRRSTSIRSQIRTLKGDVERTPEASVHEMKKRHWNSLNEDFKKELNGYLQEESRYKERYREQISRQFLIANPGASPEEARQAADRDWGDEGVFQQALRQNRAAQGTAVLGAVRARHNEMLAIEKSITELAALYQDIDTLVIQQEPVVRQAEEHAENTVTNLKAGTTEVHKAGILARHRRKLKWYCLGIVILIIAILALALGIYFGVTLPAQQRAAQGKA